MFEAIINLFKAIFVTGTVDAKAPATIFTTTLFKEVIQYPADQLLGGDLIAYIYGALIPVGIIIMMIDLGMAFTEMAIDQQITAEGIVKKLLVFIMTILILDNGIIVGGDGWIEKIYKTTTEITTEYIDSAFEVDDSKITTQIGGDPLNAELAQIKQDAEVGQAILSMLYSIILVVVFSILSAIPLMFLYGVALVRTVKLGIYMSLAPVAIACHYTKSPFGLSYIKTLLALFLQQFIILMSTKMAIQMSTSSWDPLTTVIIMTSLVGTFLGSERKAKELIG